MYYRTEIIDGITSVTEFSCKKNFAASTEGRDKMSTPQGVIFVDYNYVNRDNQRIVVMYSDFQISDPKGLKLHENKNTSFARKY